MAQVITAGQLTLYDLNDPIQSGTTPPNPVEGMLWLNTEVSPPALQTYKGVHPTGSWEIVNDVTDDLSYIRQELQNQGLITILDIDNTNDHLWTYGKNLTSTNGVGPQAGYKADLRVSQGKFSSCVFVNKTDGILSYPANVLDNTKDFTINLWIKPDSTITTVNTNPATYRLIDTGTTTSTSFMTVWGYAPIATHATNIRFVLEAGNNASAVRQYVDLASTTMFNTTTWEMLTITFEVATKTFKIYRNGVIWGSHIATKINTVSRFAINQAGWYIENLCILNNKLLTATEVKTIYDSNNPMQDPFPKVAQAPSPAFITFNIDSTGIETAAMTYGGSYIEI
jgi:hypothetical protein